IQGTSYVKALGLTVLSLVVMVMVVVAVNAIHASIATGKEQFETIKEEQEDRKNLLTNEN
ncbi:MAG: hypothetical protein GX811_08545, partial [Lentisphaerae bacterium]|nr:hypothetical protein [Lentisphaerota bacterium]